MFSINTYRVSTKYMPITIGRSYPLYKFKSATLLNNHDTYPMGLLNTKAIVGEMKTMYDDEWTKKKKWSC